MGGKNVLEFNDLNFEAEVTQASVPVLVDFSATWCGPCKMLSPIIEKLADEYAGQFKVGKLDIDESPSTTQKFGIRGVPTVLVFKGGQVVGQHVGLANKDKLVKLLTGA